MTEQFYDVYDENGNLVEAAPKEIPLQRERKELNEGEKRKLRKLYVTVQHPKVSGCGHRLDMQRTPVHINCESCLFAWFNNHGEIVQQLDEMHIAGGDKMIIQLWGKKFYHRWRQFMATVAQLKSMEGNEAS